MNPLQKADIMPKCQGLWGWMFGHKFISNHPRLFSEFVEFHDHCTRCGMPKGGK